MILQNDDISHTQHETISLTRATVAFQTTFAAGGPQSGVLAKALSEVDLTIPLGQFICLVGINGSGKSTLGHVLAGLLPLSRGKLTYPHHDDGRELIVQLIFQNPDTQIVGETVYEDVCFGLENYCTPESQIPRRAFAALAQAGIMHLHDRLVTTLSGGQKALVCIASALAVGADVLIFDEATAMLDAATRQQVLDVAKQLHRDGKTIVWITQWMDEAAQAQRIVALRNGVVEFDGSPRLFFYGTKVQGQQAQVNMPAIATATNEATAGSTTKARTPIVATSTVPAEDSPCATWPEQLDSAPCDALGLAPGYAVQTARSLLRNGIALTSLPLTIAELAREVKLLWH